MQVEAFYEVGATDSERLFLIDEYDIRYVFWGPEERAIGDWDPSQAGYLAKIYEQGEYQVYQVMNPR
jgi:uncharacterized membrane protein